MKLVILMVFAAILASLGMALFQLVRGGDSRKMANALTVRISLSVLLFLALFVAWGGGLIQPGGLR